MSTERNIAIEFTGSGSEYFGIWIVNILLTIITLGFYHPWAKVRNRKYFYNNTRIDGSVFDYHANPVAILKGWLIVVAFIICYNIISNLNPSYGMIFSAVMISLVPWAVVRSRAFNLRNSSYRNVRFFFGNDTTAAYKVFAIVGIPYLLFIFAMAYMTSFLPEPDMTPTDSGMDGPPTLVFALIGLTLFISMAMTPLFLARLYQFLINGSAFGKSHFQASVSAKTFYKIYTIAFVLSLAVIIALVVFVRTYMFNDAAMQNLAGSPEEMQQAIMGFTIITMILYLVGIYAISAYTKVATLNEMWNKAGITGNQFRSELKVLPFAWILFSNAFLILLTLGLFTPWARTRMMRYRLDNLSIDAVDDLNNFIEQRSEEMGALGEEVGDALDLEFGF